MSHWSTSIFWHKSGKNSVKTSSHETSFHETGFHETGFHEVSCKTTLAGY